METLSGSKPPIFSSTSELDSPPLSSEGNLKYQSNSRPLPAVVNSSREQSSTQKRQQTKDRFAPDFRDPDFPCRTVRYALSKRLFDLTFATVLLLLISPIMVLVALLIKLTSKGPVLFKQVRVGQGGRYFWCYKFRSMCVDAEAKQKALMHLNEASGPVFKIKRDPRVTPIGAILRRFSLDELPQFFNVIQGDMSIVGPRPPIPVEVDNYRPHARGRLAVKPGLTCLWQIGGRSSIGFDQWVEMDLYYIETMSFMGDLKIVLRTIPAVLTGSGAH